MAVAPTEVGMNGPSVRPHIQALFDKIDSQLKDPAYVAKNNKHPDKADGESLQFVFQYEGMLNTTEIQTLGNGWDDWTVHVVQNDPVNPRDSSDARYWSLRLRYDKP